MDHIRFLTAAMKDKKVGAVTPTSVSSARSICRRIDYHRPVVAVEYGPGTGVFTRHLLKRLHPDSTLIVIELNRIFARRLRRYGKRRKRKQPRLVVVRDDARNILSILDRHGFEYADYVISGIPFSLLDDQARRGIVRHTHEALVPEGKFIVYQYSFRMRSYLREYFAAVTDKRTLLNLPPLCVMEACKADQEEALIVVGDLGSERLQTSMLHDTSQY